MSGNTFTRPDMEKSLTVKLATEGFITLKQAAALFPPHRMNRPVTVSCVWRWCRHGLNTPDGPIFLEHVKVGSYTLTSLQAVTRFMEAQN